MKKTITLFLLFVFLLNVLGFYGVFLGLQFRNEVESIQALDDNRYAPEEEIMFAVPLSVPYYTNQDAEFRRTDGEFERDGEIYRKVKQKLYNDTLYVVCIKDAKGKEIRNALTEYVKTFSDKASASKNHSTKSIASFSKDYVSTTVLLETSQFGWNESVMFAEHAEHYAPAEVAQPDCPPRIG